MDYKQALDYLFSQLPMFHRIGAAAYKANLNNTYALSDLTGHPYREFKSIHVAGTNGKGSVSHMLASVCQEAGLRTGLFTSPHLVDFRERIKINGEMISPDYIAEYVTQYAHDFQIIKPSFFEMTFALAMSWFHDQKVDIAIIETGLGGRLDSTNVITPILSVITNIGYDHMQFLGNTLELIAGEKAGIIKQGVPVIIGESNSETDQVFIRKATELNSNIVFADKVIEIKPITNDLHDKLVNVESQQTSLRLITTGNKVIESPLTGDYQFKNLKTVLACADFIKKDLLKSPPVENSKSETKDDNDAVLAIFQKGIKNTIINTGLQGRWQILKRQPLTVCDIGHNTHGLPWVVKQIETQKFKKLHFVLGMVNDKDISNMLSLLPVYAVYYFCKADIPRGLDADDLKSQANEKGLQGKSYKSVALAYEAAAKEAELNDMVFIGGSAFVVAEVLPLF